MYMICTFIFQSATLFLFTVSSVVPGVVSRLSATVLSPTLTLTHSTAQHYM